MNKELLEHIDEQNKVNEKIWDALTRLITDFKEAQESMAMLLYSIEIMMARIKKLEER